MRIFCSSSSEILVLLLLLFRSSSLRFGAACLCACPFNVQCISFFLLHTPFLCEEWDALARSFALIRTRTLLLFHHPRSVCVSWAIHLSSRLPSTSWIATVVTAPRTLQPFTIIIHTTSERYVPTIHCKIHLTRSVRFGSLFVHITFFHLLAHTCGFFLP